MSDSERINESVTAEEVAKEEVAAGGDRVKADKGEEKTFAEVLGKTESGLENEFKVYQVKKFMSKVGKIFCAGEVSVTDMEYIGKKLKTYGVSSVLATDIYLAEEANIAKFKPESALGVIAMVDYPYGESPVSVKEAAIKEALRKGATRIAVAFPASSVALKKSAALIAEYGKLAKKCRVPFGVIVSDKTDEETVKGIYETDDKVKISFVIADLTRVEDAEMPEKINKLKEVAGGKGLEIMVSYGGYEKVSSVIEFGVNKVYTPFAEQVGEQLAEKFGIEI